jgi:hypothetical protein
MNHRNKMDTCFNLSSIIECFNLNRKGYSSAEVSNSMESLRASTDLKLDFGFMRRTDDFVQSVFSRFANAEGRLVKEAALKAFEAVGLPQSCDEDFEAKFMEMDSNHDGLIDMDEFVVAVKQPSSVEVWAKSVAWWQPVADAIPLQAGKEALRAVACLSNEEVDVICDSLMSAIKRMLLEEVHRLKASFQKMDSNSIRTEGTAASKFKTFKASCGKVLDFHEGLKGRVGNTI